MRSATADCSCLRWMRCEPCGSKKLPSRRSISSAPEWVNTNASAINHLLASVSVRANPVVCRKRPSRESQRRRRGLLKARRLCYRDTSKSTMDSSFTHRKKTPHTERRGFSKRRDEIPRKSSRENFSLRKMFHALWRDRARVCLLFCVGVSHASGRCAKKQTRFHGSMIARARNPCARRMRSHVARANTPM